MPRYAITETAGRFVAGTNNTGVGTVLTLTEKQAEHEVRLGTLRSLDDPKPERIDPTPTDPTQMASKEPTELHEGVAGKGSKQTVQKDAQK
jgi:hypothetical protein